VEVSAINRTELLPWLLKRHYARRIPPISHAFGLYDGANLIGVVTYGVPASVHLCRGVCGDENASAVLELNRLCVEDGVSNGASTLVGRSLKMLPSPTVVVSYADTAQGHIGYIYQATNFLFTGTTKERTDIDAGDGRHARHPLGDATQRVARSAKHRYVTFVGSKWDRRRLRESLMYPVLPYPKGKTERYDASCQVEKQPLLLFGEES